MNRAYSILDIKSVQEDERVIEGIASTPSPDRMGDIVDPMGAEFKLPMPLLWQHNHREPIGEVFFAKPTKDGIPFKARIANSDEPGKLKDRLDEAWQSIKLRLVRAVSIGFTIKAYEILKDGGWRINEWEWLELSAVTIPAQSEATINAVKSIDAQLLAATGHKHLSGERTVSAGATASRPTKVVKAQEANTMKKTIAEQIAAFEATRQAKAARMTEIMEKSAETGETLDAAQTQEYDGLNDEVKAIDAHLVRLREHEKSNVSKAVEVKGADTDQGSQSRAVTRVTVMPKKVLPGMGFTRFVMANAQAKGNPMHAYEIAKANPQWMAECPELETILKTAIAPGTTSGTTNAEPLVQYQNLTAEFIEYLRPLTIIGRIPGLRRVPFKVKIGRQTGASTVNWVGEGKVKPVSALAFDNVTLDFAKIAGIIVLTDELVRHSSPSAELLVRDDLTKAIVQFMDSQFVDPTKAANDVSPASITNGVTAKIPTGTDSDHLRADLGTLFADFLDSNLSVSSAVLIMQQQLAMRISLMRNALGQKEFPDINMNGGFLEGLPVIASEGVPATGGSPTDGSPIIMASATDILLADDGNVTIDASREASLQMESTPDSPPTTSTVLTSLWQHNLMAIRAEREINWKKRRTDAVAYISNAKYR